MDQFESFETVEDLLSAESFLTYCSGTDHVVSAQWENWMRAFPEKKLLVAQAKQLLIATLVEMDDETAHLDELRNRLSAEKKLSHRPHPGRRGPGESDQKTESSDHVNPGRQGTSSGPNGSFIMKLALAASLAILFTCILVFKPFQSENDYRHISTDKVMWVYLPDSSLMILNKGTSVRYSVQTTPTGAAAENDQVLKIHLDQGEAFFRVKEGTGTSLMIQTATGLVVEDIGTEFSVKSYQELAEEAIQVQNGLVNVTRKDSEQPVRLERNQALRIDKESGEHTWSKADRLSTSGWTTGNVALYDVRFDEVAAALGNTFDREILLSDPQLAGLRVTMLFKTSQELEDILKTLSVIYNLNALYEDGTVTITFNEESR